MTDILMPALSPTMEEGTLAKWNIKPGDTVTSGMVIAEIETDKATMEVEAVDEGVVAEILVPAGTEGVKVNAVIARLHAPRGPPPPDLVPLARWFQDLAPAAAAHGGILTLCTATARRLLTASAGVAPGRAPTSVYRRTGRPCPRCGTPIRSAPLPGDLPRTTYWCPTCQGGSR